MPFYLINTYTAASVNGSLLLHEVIQHTHMQCTTVIEFVKQMAVDNTIFEDNRHINNNKCTHVAAMYMNV